MGVCQDIPLRTRIIATTIISAPRHTPEKIIFGLMCSGQQHARQHGAKTLFFSNVCVLSLLLCVVPYGCHYMWETTQTHTGKQYQDEVVQIFCAFYNVFTDDLWHPLYIRELCRPATCSYSTHTKMQAGRTTTINSSRWEHGRLSRLLAKWFHEYIASDAPQYCHLGLGTSDLL